MYCIELYLQNDCMLTVTCGKCENHDSIVFTCKHGQLDGEEYILILSICHNWEKTLIFWVISLLRIFMLACKEVLQVTDQSIYTYNHIIVYTIFSRYVQKWRTYVDHVGWKRQRDNIIILCFMYLHSLTGCEGVTMQRKKGVCVVVAKCTWVWRKC